MSKLDVWYARLDVDEIDAAAEVAARGQAAQALPQERGQGAVEGQHEGASTSWSTIVDGRPRLISDPPLIVPIRSCCPTRSATRSRTRCRASCTPTAAPCEADHRHLLEGFRFADVARKVVGVGSVGTRAWIVLLVGNDDQRPAVPPGQGGAGLGARSPSSARARTPTTVSGSSRVSG